MLSCSRKAFICSITSRASVIMPSISITPTFSPNLSSLLSLSIRPIREVNTVAAATMAVKMRIKNRNGCLRENMGLITPYTYLNQSEL